MGTCSECQHYRMTADGPYCFKDARTRAVSPIQKKQCFTRTTMEEQATKKCSKCGRILPVSEFGRHHKTKDGYQPVCRECRSKAQSRKKKAEPAADDKPDLSAFSDAQLWDELKARGWAVTGDKLTKLMVMS